MPAPAAVALIADHLPPAPVEYLTIAQLATRLQLSRSTVYWWVEVGELPCLRLGRQIRFIPQEVDEFLQRQRSLAAQPGYHQRKGTHPLTART